MKKIFTKTFFKRLWIAYSLFSVFIVLFLINNLICKDIDKTSDRLFIDDKWTVTINDESFSDVNLETFKFDSLDIGYKISMSRVLPDDWDYVEPALCIYVKHTTVDMYVDDTLIYSYGNERLKLGKAVGSGIQFTNFSNDYKGMTIRVDMEVTEDNPFTRLNSFYITEWNNSYRFVMTENFVPFIVGAFLVVFGVFVVLISSFAITFSRKYTNLFLLAIFSICMGLWTLCYNNILIVFSIPLYSCSLIEYMALYIAPLPLLGFVYSYVKKLSSKKLNIIFIFLLALQFIYTTVGIGLHTADIVHAASILKYFHMLVVLHLIFFTYVFGKNIKLNYINKRTYSIGLLLVALTVMYDMVYYNLQRALGFDSFNIKGLSSIGITVFLAILALDVYYDITKKMMEENEKALLINHAYTDQLTELNNRRYCAEYMNKLDEENNTNYSIIVFDLNNLKIINDEQGHSIGDLFIKKAATLIFNSFKENGVVGRLGGDEFIAIINTKDTGILTDLIFAFENNIKEYNDNNSDFNISIAYGYATCDEASNTGTEKTYSLADNRMYECKGIQKKAL